MNEYREYLYIAIDYVTRITIAVVYNSLNSTNAKDLLERMKLALGTKIKAVNTDNGGEFHRYFHKACQQEPKILHFFTYPRTPKMNPFIERFNRTIQEEANLPLVADSLETWNKYVAHYILQYNFFRPHQAIDYKTPVEKFLEKPVAPWKSCESNMLWTYTNI